MVKTFAAQRLAEENIFYDAAATFGLGPAALEALELPGTALLLELSGTTRTDCIVDALVHQSEAVDFIIEASVGDYRLEERPVNLFQFSRS